MPEDDAGNDELEHGETAPRCVLTTDTGSVEAFNDRH
jgi:hypothetical protein